MELMLALVLVSVVFLAAATLQSSAAKMLRSRQLADVSQRPEIAAESIARMASVANQAVVSADFKSLSLRVDFDLCSDTRATPTSTTTDDTYWHYQFNGGQLLQACSNAAALPGGGWTTMLTNLSTVGAPPNYPPGTGSGPSGFRFVNPSGAGNPNVVYIHINSTSPALEINTESRTGAGAKR